jgi:nucleoside-diphosphate-sugar epimerase
VRAFVTGATGFLGGALVRALRERGDEVAALVRDPSRARRLTGEIVEGDVSDRTRLATQMQGSDAVFHVAAMYEVGIPRSAQPRMFEANVRGTENVLDAAVDAGVRRIVYVSTINVFGNTHEHVVDETYGRPGGDFVSYYDETKYLAHVAARNRIDRGAPVVIVQPGAVYGPGDHSELGAQLAQARAGKLKFLALADVGVNAVHVDDVAVGLLLAHDRGRVGESYVLGGRITRLRELIAIVSRQAGRRPPRLEIPTALVKLMIPLGPLVGRAMGTGPNLRELIAAADGVTYWASDEKARRELGYAPRPLEEGLRTLATSSGADGRAAL